VEFLGGIMEGTASIVSAQQQGTQNNLMLSFIKQNAQAEQSLVNMIAQSSPSGGRGQNVDLTV
jgi:hypothetical protein